jgi:hypothetical protein
MNERIKELIKQAGLNIDGYGDPIWGCLDGEDEKREFLEKFAELIIRECANIAMQADIDGCNIGNRAWQKINEHFGV